MTKMTPAIYGAAPVDLGLLNLDTSEMMFWLAYRSRYPVRHSNGCLIRSSSIIDRPACLDGCHRYLWSTAVDGQLRLSLGQDHPRHP